MYNDNTNVESLGTEYTVTAPDGTILKTIQVIPYSEILDAALGRYTDQFASMSDYLEQSISVLSGFESVDTHRVLWYATSDEEVVLAELIEFAISNGYDKIILEHLEYLDDPE